MIVLILIIFALLGTGTIHIAEHSNADNYRGPLCVLFVLVFIGCALLLNASNGKVILAMATMTVSAVIVGFITARMNH